MKFSKIPQNAVGYANEQAAKKERGSRMLKIVVAGVAAVALLVWFVHWKRGEEKRASGVDGFRLPSGNR